MRNGDDDEVGQLVVHPAAMIGASDAGAHVLANTDSCYAVWTLQHWVRERQALSLERAVAKLTGTRPDCSASMIGACPAGAWRPTWSSSIPTPSDHRSPVRRRPTRAAAGAVTDATGIEMSVVNGVVATREGRSTGARPGEAPPGRLMLLLPEAAVPRPVRTTVGRRPGSIRRTSSHRHSPTHGLLGELVVTARARDLLTAADGSTTVAGEVAFSARIDGGSRQLSMISATPPAPVLDGLVGSLVGPGFRSKLAQAAPGEQRAGTLLHLLLDDLVGATLVSGYAMQRGERSPAPTDRRSTCRR